MCTEIIHNFWVSEYKISKNIEFLKNKNIKLLINVSNNIPFYKSLKESNIQYYRYELIDENLKNKRIDKLLTKINKFLTNNQGVLVYCNTGIQYSPIILSLYLIKYSNISITDIETTIITKNKNIFQPHNNLRHICDKYIHYNNKNI